MANRRNSRAKGKKPAAKTTRAPAPEKNPIVVKPEIANPERPAADKPSTEQPPVQTSPIPQKRALEEAEKPDAQEPAAKKQKETSPPKEGGSRQNQMSPSPADQPVSKPDKETWQGFCEIESEPVYFSAMIKEMGVKGVTVSDTISLDPSLLQDLPQPIYGVILLFRYRPVSPEGDEDECPSSVWFANQMPAQNSCATLAMLNILLNIPHVEIGDHLTEFKKFSQDLTPYQRGEALESFEFVKKIHNSFAKNMDMLEDDKRLATKVKKSQHTRRSSQESANSDSSTSSIEENAHHFIAYVPVDGEVWVLDGMQHLPTSKGKYDEANPYEWLSIVSEHIKDMSTIAGDTEYAMFTLAQSPLQSRRKDMCECVATIKLVESCLNAIEPDWSSFVASENGTAETLTSPSLLGSLGVFNDLLSDTTLADSLRSAIEAEDMPALLSRMERLLSRQADLQQAVLSEMATESDMEQKARERRWDYGPVIKKWLEMLTKNGYLEKNLKKFENSK